MPAGRSAEHPVPGCLQRSRRGVERGGRPPWATVASVSGTWDVVYACSRAPVTPIPRNASESSGSPRSRNPFVRWHSKHLGGTPGHPRRPDRGAGGESSIASASPVRAGVSDPTTAVGKQPGKQRLVKNGDFKVSTTAILVRQVVDHAPSRGGLTPRRATGTLGAEMSNDPVPVEHVEHLELPVEELLRRGRPFPPRGEMVIDDLTPEEGEAFLEAVRS